MTVNATPPISGPYVANGSNRLWDFQFRADELTHLWVEVQDGEEEPVYYTTGFSAVGLGDQDGGTVTYPIAPADPLAAGLSVRIIRAVPYDQPTRIGNQGAFYPEVHESAFDRLAMQVQQLAAGGIGTAAAEAVAEAVAAAAISVDARDEAVAAVAGISADADAAEAAAIAAAASAAAALVSENNAETAETNAEAAQAAAAASASAASTSAGTASTAATNASNSATAADGSADAAAASAIAAAADAASADGSATAASDAAVMANLWAEQAEDVEVAPGQFSAYHWAQKAEAAVIGSDALSVSFTPYGDIAAVNVQAALEELDDEKEAVGVAAGLVGAVAADLAAHEGLTNNPHAVTKAQVGLGNADNTSDANKPVSTATQTALDLKANLAGPTFTGVPAAPTAAPGTNTTQLATAAFVTAAVAAAALPDATDAVKGKVELATAAEYAAGTDSTRAIVPSIAWAAANYVTLVDGANIAVDFALGFNFGGAANTPLALGGNRALSAPSNVNKIQSGVLWFTASGSTRTLTLNAAWLLADGVETGPYSITTAQRLGIAYVVEGTEVIVTAIIRRAA